MDDRTVSLHLNSASTSAEACQDVAKTIGLTDTYGFSLYISLYEKVSFTSLSLVSSYQRRPSRHLFAYKCVHTLVFTYTVNPVSECCSTRAKLQHLVGLLSPDVVSGQLREACVGRSVSVRAGDEEAGQAGEGRPLEALHPEGTVHTLA